MTRHVECTRNKKQNRRNYQGSRRTKTRHYDINRNEEKRKWSRNTRTLHFYSGIPKEKRAKRGVSILVKKRYERYITTWEALNENVIQIHMNLFGRKLCILEIYTISDDKNALVKEDFWGEIK